MLNTLLHLLILLVGGCIVLSLGRAVMEGQAPTLRMQLCGSRLADALAVVCGERGYAQNKRGKRQVVDECCRNLCTLYNMQQYCTPTNAPVNYTAMIGRLEKAGFFSKSSSSSSSSQDGRLQQETEVSRRATTRRTTPAITTTIHPYLQSILGRIQNIPHIHVQSRPRHEPTWNGVPIYDHSAEHQRREIRE